MMFTSHESIIHWLQASTIGSQHFLINDGGCCIIQNVQLFKNINNQVPFQPLDSNKKYYFFLANLKYYYNVTTNSFNIYKNYFSFYSDEESTQIKWQAELKMNSLYQSYVEFHNCMEFGNKERLESPIKVLIQYQRFVSAFQLFYININSFS